MQAGTKQRMDALLASSAGLVVEAYLEELIDDKRKEYDSCSVDNFLVKKGEIVGLMQLLNYVKKRGS